MKFIKIILTLALVLFAVLLASENQEIVHFNYLVAQGEFHLSILLGLVFVLGFLIAWIIFGTLQFKSKLIIRRQRRQLKKLGVEDATIATKKQKKAKVVKAEPVEPKKVNKTEAPKTMPDQKVLSSQTDNSIEKNK